MIKRIKFSHKDRRFLALKSIEAKALSVNFSKLVVNKPWGYEYLLTSTPLVEVWHLSLDHDKSTSMHCHPNKKTALIVLDGKARFSHLNGTMDLKPLDTVTIDSGVFHSTQCLSKNGLKLLEIETPPMKHDLIRLEDKYGRANTGYEGRDKMKVVNGSYMRFDNNSESLLKNFCKKDILLSLVKNKTGLNRYPLKSAKIAVVVRGFIKSKQGKITHNLGDVIELKKLKGNKYNFENVSLLSIS